MSPRGVIVLVGMAIIIVALILITVGVITSAMVMGEKIDAGGEHGEQTE